MKQNALRIDIARIQGITEIDFQGIYGYGFYPGKIREKDFLFQLLGKQGNRLPV